MRFSQIISMLAIALGVAFLVAGSSLSPSFPNEMAAMAQNFGRNVSPEVPAFLKGIGAGFLTLGLLGLVVPWVNVLIAHFRQPPATPTNKD